MLKSNHDEQIAEQMIQLYPYLREEALSYYRVSDYEIAFMLKNGKTVIYNEWDWVSMRTTTKPPQKARTTSQEEWTESFSRKLKRKMYEKGFSMQRLSNETGISVASISNYYHGKMLPTIYNATKIAEALDCPVSELVYFN